METKEDFCVKWDKIILSTRDACNFMALPHLAKVLLDDWCSIGVQWKGRDCHHLKFLLYQIVFLVFDPHLSSWGSGINSILQAK